MTDLEALKAAALAATPGEWFIYKATPWRIYDKDKLLAEVRHSNNAPHIAAANPAAILALIARLEAAEADAARFRWLDDNAGYYGLGDDLRIEWRGSGSSIRAAIDAAMKTGG